MSHWLVLWHMARSGWKMDKEREVGHGDGVSQSVSTLDGNWKVTVTSGFEIVCHRNYHSIESGWTIKRNFLPSTCPLFPPFLFCIVRPKIPRADLIALGLLGPQMLRCEFPCLCQICPPPRPPPPHTHSPSRKASLLANSPISRISCALPGPQANGLHLPVKSWNHSSQPMTSLHVKEGLSSSPHHKAWLSQSLLVGSPPKSNPCALLPSLQGPPLPRCEYLWLVTSLVHSATFYYLGWKNIPAPMGCTGGDQNTFTGFTAVNKVDSGLALRWLIISWQRHLLVFCVCFPQYWCEVLWGSKWKCVCVCEHLH